MGLVDQEARDATQTRSAVLDYAHTITEAPIGCVQGVRRAWGVRTANKGQLRSYSYVKVSTAVSQ